ncbi:hypothetical protein ACQ4M3_40385 [Leptolyngbya sp. AN03gr2]|uniref:hypothetical protein n=1 Tax=unclassified Leptolyngbya TaxID=2650499 RepID=UPI003D30FEF6
MPKKGQKKLRGQPELYDEVKGQVNLSLTSTSVQGLDEQAAAIGLSRSEFVEQIGRRLLSVISDADKEILREALQHLIERAEAELSDRLQESSTTNSGAETVQQQIEQWRQMLAKLV